MLNNVNKNGGESTTPIFFFSEQWKGRIKESISSQFESFVLHVKADEHDLKNACAGVAMLVRICHLLKLHTFKTWFLIIHR